MTFPTFIGAPPATLDELGDARIAVFGASEATPYGDEPSHSARAPAAIREASLGFAGQLGQLDFDLDATPFPKAKVTGVVDLGDLLTRVAKPRANRERIREATAGILAAGAVPIVLGGDDSVPIPVLEGYAEHGPVEIVQIDAHVDWGGTIRGEPLGYGSPMRRLAALPHVTGMTQVGIRGLGSGEAWQIDDARAWGSRLITSRMWRRDDVDAALSGITPGARVVVCIDCDGIDPAVFPAVAMPTPGGLLYDDVIELLHGVAARGTIAGLVLAEYVPDRDDARRSCATIAARIAAVTIGLAMRGSAGARETGG